MLIYIFVIHLYVHIYAYFAYGGRPQKAPRVLKAAQAGAAGPHPPPGLREEDDAAHPVPRGMRSVVWMEAL